MRLGWSSGKKKLKKPGPTKAYPDHEGLPCRRSKKWKGRGGGVVGKSLRFFPGGGYLGCHRTEMRGIERRIGGTEGWGKGPNISHKKERIRKEKEDPDSSTKEGMPHKRKGSGRLEN